MNNKGSFKDDGSFGSKVKGFFKESGFYIAIVVGLCALAAGVVFFSTNQILTDPDQYEAKENGTEQNNNIGIIDNTDPDFAEPDQSSIIDSNGSGFAEEGPYEGFVDDGLVTGDDYDFTAELDEEPIVESDEDSRPKSVDAPKTVGSDDVALGTSGEAAELDENQATQDVVLAVVRPAFGVPVTGKVQTEYSMDKLVFSPTFNEWRTHSGVDIAAPRGEAVRTVGNGTVLEIKNDPRYGFTVVIDHNNGYKSLYANLASDQTLQVGQKVKQGDPIGSVGATAIFESAEPTHLHFELYKENKLVDPTAYIDIPK